MTTIPWDFNEFSTNKQLQLSHEAYMVETSRLTKQTNPEEIAGIIEEAKPAVISQVAVVWSRNWPNVAAMTACAMAFGSQELALQCIRATINCTLTWLAVKSLQLKHNGTKNSKHSG